MTFKELCSKYLICGECPACVFCPFNDRWAISPNNFTVEDDEEVTGAIIETAKILACECEVN